MSATAERNRAEQLLHGDRARARAATTVWRGEGFMQVDMKHIDSEISGARDSHHRVQVRAIALLGRASRDAWPCPFPSL